MIHLNCFAATICFYLFVHTHFSMATSLPNNIFILGGQSNMAGRGGITKDPITNKNIWDGYIPSACQSSKSILRFNADSKWEEAREPLHRDIDYNKTNGIGPGMAFANELLAKAGESVGVIGLVPCAIGGTHLREWIKGTDNYTRLVDRIKASEAHGGKVQAFFWYQGESDASVEEEAKFYESNLTKFFTDLREDLHYPDLPIILVKITTHDFFVNPISSFLDEVRKAQEAITLRLQNIKSIDGLKVLGNPEEGLAEDKGHFNVKTEVRLGKTFADVFYSNFGSKLTC